MTSDLSYGAYIFFVPRIDLCAVSFMIKFQRKREGCKSLCFVATKILEAYLIMQSITSCLVNIGKLVSDDTRTPLAPKKCTRASSNFR
jgi:hypothetical protein